MAKQQNALANRKGELVSEDRNHFMNSAPPPTPEETLFVLGTSRPTGIYDPANIKASKTRKLHQISIGPDDFQLPA
jgi:hypothetical protein